MGSSSAKAAFDRIRRRRPLVAQAQSTAPRPPLQKIDKIILIIWELLDSMISVKVKGYIHSQIDLKLNKNYNYFPHQRIVGEAFAVFVVVVVGRRRPFIYVYYLVRQILLLFKIS
jgi:hypothetical protein